MNAETTKSQWNSTDENCGIIALVGRANVGKSTLMNCLLEEKVRIVSRVAQTTRNLVRAILTEDRGQLVFLDTPGIHKGKAPLNKIMNATARTAVEGVDVIVTVFDAGTTPKPEDKEWMRQISKSPTKAIFLLNKIDLEKDYETNYQDAWKTISSDTKNYSEPLWLRTSSRTGEGVSKFLATLFSLVPKGPRLFPEDILTDFPRRWTISDVIREKLFHLLYQELPHSIEVNVTDIRESTDRWTVFADILVHKHSQKKIVIGYKGRQLRKVKRQATRELSEMFGIDFELNLWVKVVKHWDQNSWILRELGYQS